jgi:hypothetical protein
MRFLPLRVRWPNVLTLQGDTYGDKGKGRRCRHTGGFAVSEIALGAGSDAVTAIDANAVFV